MRWLNGRMGFLVATLSMYKPLYKKRKITMQFCGGTESRRSAGCTQEHFELLGNILDPKYTQFLCILQFSANLQIFTSAK